jgi:hypothetical protein
MKFGLLLVQVLIVRQQQLSQLQRTVLSLQSQIFDLQEEVMNTRSFLELWYVCYLWMLILGLTS